MLPFTQQARRRQITVTFCKFTRQRQDETQAILEIVLFGLMNQPIPVEFRKADQDPGQGFYNPGVDMPLA